MKKFLNEYGLVILYVLIGAICIATLLGVMQGKATSDMLSNVFEPEYTTNYEKVTVNEDDFVVNNGVLKVGEAFNVKDEKWVKVTATDGTDMSKYISFIGTVDTLVPNTYKVKYEFKWNGLYYNKEASFLVEPNYETYTLKFSVKALDGTALKNMRVYLDTAVASPLASPLHFSVITDNNGNCTIEGVTPGKYDLIIGDNTYSIKVVNSNDNYEVSINGSIKKV